MKHTPRPWKVKNNSGKNFEYMICNPDYSKWPIACEVEKANAKLIAAAPDLLEACKKLLKNGYDWDMNENTFDAQQSAIEAINKAEAK